MRSLWKGTISFGLVNIPVKLYLATESHDVGFNLIHRPCATPIKYRRHCPLCQRDVEPEEISRGYDYGDGSYVLMEDEDFASLPLRTDRSIEIQDFIDAREIDPIYYEKSYYIEPAEGGRKACALLLEAMRQTGRVAVAKVALRTKESLATVRIYHGPGAEGPPREILLLETMFFAEEIRPYHQLAPSYQNATVSERELTMAKQLIESLNALFIPEKYRNEYREALLAVIEEKARGRKVATRPQAVAPPLDLMEALEESLRLIRDRGATGPALAPAETPGQPVQQWH